MQPEYQDHSDAALARETREGRLDAFEQLVFRYERRLFGFVSRWCRSEANAREITQDTFVRAFQRIEQFDSAYEFAPWLFAIARRKCLDRYRVSQPLASESLPEPEDVNDPASILARKETGANIWAIARGSLSAAQFEVLWLRYAEDLDVAQIARVVGKTKTHVKVLLFRARATLARKLNAFRPEQSCSADSEEFEALRPLGTVSRSFAPVNLPRPSTTSTRSL